MILTTPCWELHQLSLNLPPREATQYPHLQLSLAWPVPIDPRRVGLPYRWASGCVAGGVAALPSHMPLGRTRRFVRGASGTWGKLNGDAPVPSRRHFDSCRFLQTSVAQGSRLPSITRVSDYRCIPSERYMSVIFHSPEARFSSRNLG